MLPSESCVTNAPAIRAMRGAAAGHSKISASMVSSIQFRWQHAPDFEASFQSFSSLRSVAGEQNHKVGRELELDAKDLRPEQCKHAPRAAHSSRATLIEKGRE